MNERCLVGEVFTDSVLGVGIPDFFQESILVFERSMVVVKEGSIYWHGEYVLFGYVAVKFENFGITGFCPGGRGPFFRQNAPKLLAPRLAL